LGGGKELSRIEVFSAITEGIFREIQHNHKLRFGEWSAEGIHPCGNAKTNPVGSNRRVFHISGSESRVGREGGARKVRPRTVREWSVHQETKLSQNFHALFRLGGRPSPPTLAQWAGMVRMFEVRERPGVHETQAV
jgi:hypothetical protein